jgi:hypothetical protein
MRIVVDFESAYAVAQKNAAAVSVVKCKFVKFRIRPRFFARYHCELGKYSRPQNRATIKIIFAIVIFDFARNTARQPRSVKSCYRINSATLITNRFPKIIQTDTNRTNNAHASYYNSSNHLINLEMKM